MRLKSPEADETSQLKEFSSALYLRGKERIRGLDLDEIHEVELNKSQELFPHLLNNLAAQQELKFKSHQKVVRKKSLKCTPENEMVINHCHKPTRSLSFHEHELEDLRK